MSYSKGDKTETTLTSYLGVLHSPYNFVLKDPKETIVEHVLEQAAKSCEMGLGDVKFVENAVTGEFYQTGDIEPLSRKIASSLRRRGMKKGDVVLYSSHECSVYIFMLGVWRAGGIMRAIYPEENAPTMTARLLESKAKWFLIDRETLDDAKKAVESDEMAMAWPVEIIVSDRSFKSLGSKEEQGDSTLKLTSLQDLLDDDGNAFPELSEVTINKDDISLILSTSGTTGLSKGCVYTQLGIMRITEAMGLFVTGPTINREDGENLMVLPLSRPTHISAVSINLHLMAIPRVQFVMMRQVTKDNIFKAVHKYKPHTVYGFTTYLLLLANDPEASKYDVSSIKCVVTGGVLVQPSFVNTMQEKLGAQVVVGYGMTEAPIFTCSRNLNYTKSEDGTNWEDFPERSVGTLWPGASLKVRDEETGQILGPNQHGELCIRSDTRFAEYWNRPEETAKTVVDGFLHTGDVGYYDENGFVFVVNRSKECFKYYNNHIIPSEVEQVILSHPAVDTVSVVGIPDPKGGDTIPRAFVTLKKGSGQEQEQVSAKELRIFANENLASYKRLRGGLIILQQLPLGKTGKVDTALLKQIQISVDSEE